VKKTIKILLAVSAIVCVLQTPSFSALAVAVAVHELGHVITARLLNVNLTKLRWGIFGFRLNYEKYNLSLFLECAVCAGGSVFGLLCAEAVRLSPLVKNDTCAYFIIVSVSLSLFNLLPIHGLDGGAITERILESFLLPDSSYKASKAISIVFSVLFWCIAVRIQLRHEPALPILVLSIYLLLTSLKEK